MFLIADATPPVLNILPGEEDQADRPDGEAEAMSPASPSLRTHFDTRTIRADLVEAYPDLDTVCDHLG